MQKERDVDFYRKKIIEMVEKIKNPTYLRRIYQLAEYMYIQKKEKE